MLSQTEKKLQDTQNVLKAAFRIYMGACSALPGKLLVSVMTLYTF